MNKIWHLYINGVGEGPFSLDEIRGRSDVTIDTLAWKEGMDNWLPIQKIPELKVLFVDPQSDNEENSENHDKEQKDEIQNELKGVNDLMVLELKKDPDYFIYFLIIAILLLFYLFIRS